jgi:hypothetical protein
LCRATVSLSVTKVYKNRLSQRGLVSPMAGEVWYASSVLFGLMLFGNKSSAIALLPAIDSYLIRASYLLLFLWRIALLVHSSQGSKRHHCLLGSDIPKRFASSLATFYKYITLTTD